MWAFTGFASAALCGLTLVSGADAQPLPTVGRGSGFLTIRGQTVTVRYYSGSLDRASHVLSRLDLIIGDLQKRGKRPISLTAFVIPREQWGDGTPTRPYGLPLTMAGSSVILVPALGDAGTVKLWEHWLGTELPRLSGFPLRGSVKAASSLVLADVFLQRAAAGVFVDRHELIGRRPWVRGLLTHLVALELFARYEPSRMIEIEMTYRTLGRQLSALSQLREGEPMPVEDWLLTETRYFAAALAIFREEGRSAVKRALKLRSKSEGPLSEDAVLKLFPSLRSIRFDETEPQAAVESLE